MGKKKKGKYTKKRANQATSVGVVASALYAGIKALTDKSGTTTNAIDQIKIGNYAFAVDKMTTALKQRGTVTTVAVMVGASAAPQIPVLKIVAKPIDRKIRATSKGKASL